MKNLESRIKLLMPLFLILIALFSPLHVFATDPTPCVDADSIAKGFGPCPAGLTEFEGVFGNIISVIVGLGFIAMLVLLVMAGFKYLTSGGEPKAIQSAHHTLAWAILGVLLMIVAWILLQLIQAFTGIDVTVFNLKTLCSVNVGGVIKDICQP